MANRFDQLIDHWDDVLRKAFTDAVYQMRSAAQIEQIARMLEKGDVEGAIRAVGLDPAQFRELDKAIGQAFEAGGDATAKLVPIKRLDDGLRVIFIFRVRNPAAEQWISDRSSTKVTEILDDQRIMIREQLLLGMQEGRNPRSVALDLVGRIDKVGKRQGGLIGLTSSQAQWVNNYEQELSSDNPLVALSRGLRDARFDGAVKKAASTGEPIPEPLKAKMVTAYRNRALRFRAEAIGRTEAIAALHESQQQAMEQAVQSGVVDQTAVSFIWRTARDSRVRDSHAAMEGQKVKFGEKFTTGNGYHLEFPGDPSAPASEVINCRCWREPKVDFLAGVR